LNRPPWYMLSPGQFVRVRMPIGNPRPALLLPEKALGVDQGQRYVFVVNDKNEVERRNVKIGPQFGTLRVIENHLVKEADRVKETDRVIVDGLLRVRPGGKVDPKPADSSLLPDLNAASIHEIAPLPRLK
jgi:membrane fusion protein, multidrug efflux system